MDLNEIPASERFARHPWETVRAAFFLDRVGEVIADRPGPRILDAGSGDAWFARQMVGRFARVSVTCFDPGYTVGANVLPTPEPRLEFTAVEPLGRFDAVTLLDVLEHVEDDVRFVGWLVERLEPGGELVISVPAWQALFSRHDAALLHFRRYRPRRLAAMLEDAGLEILESGGLFHSLLPARALLVGAERLRRARTAGEVDPQHALQWRGGPRSRHVLESVLKADSGLSRLASRRAMPLPGLSWWARCRRP
jgi:SAM-dependent methyltransferase